ncbi:MAG: hypothetical protein ABI543_01125 [Ignavibacteria bacterium]
MILVRDIFHLKFGKAKDAKVLLNDARELNRKYGFDKTRALTDLVTGHSYTLVLESEWNSLADWENSMKQGLGAEDWQKWYQKFIPLVESASREILNIVE